MSGGAADAVPVAAQVQVSFVEGEGMATSVAGDIELMVAHAR
jgi:hypothetical protein